MADDGPQSLDESLRLIRERAHEDPKLAAALRTVLSELLSQLPEPVLEATQPAPDPEPIWDEPEASGEPPEKPLDYAEWPDLDAVAVNLDLKAKAARWVAEHGYTEERGALNERYALLDEARASDSFLWMLDRNRVNPYATQALSEVAELYTLTVRALAVW